MTPWESEESMGKFNKGMIKGTENIQDKKEDKSDEKKVSVTSILIKDADTKHVGQETIFIPRNIIDKNPRNEYSIKGIASLAQSIKVYGLSQPIEVKKQPNGRYMLLGGERRTTAIDYLIDNPEEKDYTPDVLIACVEKNPSNIDLNLSEEKKEDFAILTTNKEARKYTDGDSFKEIKKWKAIIEELRANGEESFINYDEDNNEVEVQIKGAKTRDIIAQTTGMSVGQVNKFAKVDNRAEDELKNALLDNQVSLSVAAKAVDKLNSEEQKVLAEAAKNGKITSKDVDSFKKKKADKKITKKSFLKDIHNIEDLLAQGDIILSGADGDKYENYIRQLENLIKKHV